MLVVTASAGMCRMWCTPSISNNVHPKCSTKAFKRFASLLLREPEKGLSSWKNGTSEGSVSGGAIWFWLVLCCLIHTLTASPNHVPWICHIPWYHEATIHPWQPCGHKWKLGGGNTSYVNSNVTGETGLAIYRWDWSSESSKPALLLSLTTPSTLLHPFSRELHKRFNELIQNKIWQMQTKIWVCVKTYYYQC